MDSQNQQAKNTNLLPHTIAVKLQLYAVVAVVLSGLITLVAAIHLYTDWRSYDDAVRSNQLIATAVNPLTAIPLLSLIVGLLPIVFGLYMLAGKRAAVIKAFLIITGLAFAYSFVNCGIAFAKTPTIYLAVAGLIAGGLVYWTWQVFSAIENLEETDNLKN
jgi:ABC-type methionine transport system permease subunit